MSDGFFRGPDGRLGPVIHLDDRDPAFEALLRATPGEEASAIDSFTNYWDDIDYDSRNESAERYWLVGR